MDLTTTIMICSMFHANAIVSAMIQNGSQQNPLAITVIAQVDKAEVTKSDFKNITQAATFAKKKLAEGNQLEIGMMQIPSKWLQPLSRNGVTIESLLRPCKNIAVATDLLNQSEAYCATFTNTGTERDQCTLSFYKTGDPKAGLDYAKKILDYTSANPMGSYDSQSSKVNYNLMMETSNFALPKPVFTENEDGLRDANEK